MELEMSDEMMESAINEMVSRHVEEENAFAQQWHSRGAKHAAEWVEAATVEELVMLPIAYRLLKTRRPWETVRLPEAVEKDLQDLAARHQGIYERGSFVRGWMRGLCLGAQRLNKTGGCSDRLVSPGYI